jgi:hypothetical protein
VVTCLCCGSGYRYSRKTFIRGKPRKNPLCNRNEQPLSGDLLVAATIVGAIRLHGEPIKNSPKVVSTIFGFDSASADGTGGLQGG